MKEKAAVIPGSVGYGTPEENAWLPGETAEQWCERMGAKAAALGVEVYFPMGPPQDGEEGYEVYEVK